MENLLVNQQKIISIDDKPGWIIDIMTYKTEPDYGDGYNLSQLDKIPMKWLKELTSASWIKIYNQKTLNGIPIPEEWIKVWRFILKDPRLREYDPKYHRIGSSRHLWAVWAEDCIKKYLTPLEKEILSMHDAGLPYAEIGFHCLGKYGDEFWKPRKTPTKTTPAQVVNFYLYLKMPTSIAKKELLDMCLKRIGFVT